MREEIDFSYALEFYNRLEAVHMDNLPLTKYFECEGSDYWQFYKQRIFEEIKTFSRTKHIVRPRANRFSKTVDFCVYVGVVLSTVFSLMRKRKALVYAIDKVDPVHKSDFRLSTVYAFLKRAQISYLEIFHTVIGGATIKHFFQRRRIVTYLEAADRLYPIAVWLKLHKPLELAVVTNIALENFSEREREFAITLIQKYLRQIDISRFKIMFFSFLMRKSKCKIFLAIDDARYYYELLRAAKLAKVPSYAFQHGHFTKYHVGWLRSNNQYGESTYPDHFLVSSEYWKQELTRLGGIMPSHTILVSGDKTPTPDTAFRDMREESKIHILIPYETACPKHEVAVYIRSFLSIKNVHVIFKLRPDMSTAEQLKEYGLQELKDSRFETAVDIGECIERVDIVAGVYSTFLYDMILYKKRVVILDTSSDYGEGMYENGLADLLKRGRDLETFIWQIKKLPDSLIVERKTKLLANGITLEQTLKDIVEKHIHDRLL